MLKDDYVFWNTLHRDKSLQSGDRVAASFFLTISFSFTSRIKNDLKYMSFPFLFVKVSFVQGIMYTRSTLHTKYFMYPFSEIAYYCLRIYI